MNIPKSIVIIISVILSILFFSNTGFCFGEVQKAKEFMAAGMYPQATELLEKRINDKPTDAEAHFQLGICYINQGNYNKADERFGSAVRLKSDYGYKIGGEYKRVGDAKWNKEDINGALYLFRKSVTYQPNLKTDIAKKCFDKAVLYLSQNRMRSNEADELFALAVRYKPAFAVKANDIKRVYAKKMLDIVKPLSRAKQKPYVKEAKKYLSQTEIDKEIPPPTWKSRPGFPKTFVGKGFNKNDAIIIAVNGTNMFYGDKVLIAGSEFSTGINGRKKIKEKKFIVQSRKKGLPYRIRSATGVQITVDIRYFE